MKPLMLLFLLIVLGFNVSIGGTYSGGNGTSGNPYQIANSNDLSELVSTTSDWNTGIYFIQTANITVSGTWSPIGISSNSFKGNYNGQNYTISGITINNSSTYAGLFGYTSGAAIENLGVINVSISANSSIGGLIGYANTTNVSNCYSTGSLTAYYDKVGGLIGEYDWGGTVNNCYSTASVQGASSGSGSYAGGLIGRVVTSGTISNSYHTTGDVLGKSYVGGLIGAAQAGSVSSCYSSGSVAGGIDVGGLIGYNNCSVNACYSTSYIGGTQNVGGFIGNNNGATVTTCYSTGTVDANNTLGGFVGYNSSFGIIEKCYTSSTSTVTGGLILGGFGGENVNSTIRNCYSHNNVVRTIAGQFTSSTGSFVGKNYADASYSSTINYCYAKGSVTYDGATNPTDKGFVGSEEGGGTKNYTANYFDNQTSAQTSGTGATGKTTAQMTTEALVVPNFYITAGWDFKTSSNLSGIWNINSTRNSGYPFLTCQYPEDEPLPVELLTLTAVYINNKIELTWQTATEINNYGFEIESSVNNEEFLSIGFIKGFGNSNNVNNYSFYDIIDENLKNINQISYRLKQIDNDGNFRYIAEITVNLNSNDLNYTLCQNYPNPFNPSTNINFTLPKTEFVTLKIYDALGKEVTTIINEELNAGNYTKTWDSKNLSSGVYFYKLDVGGFTETKKMMLMR